MKANATEAARAPFEKHYLDLREQVQRSLETFLPHADSCPPELLEAMRYTLLAGGKRFRAVLCLLAGEAVGGGGDLALRAACAVEMVHTYSLVHDDLPAMDDDAFRRGRPTCHKVFGEAMAILAGDALLTHAFQTLAQGVRAGANAEVVAALVDELARGAGVSGMVGGQADDISTTGRTIGREALESIHRRKTACLIRAAARVGALAGNAPEEWVNAIGDYGLHLGLAFQIVDDLLDVEGQEGQLGKAVGRDRERGKTTYPSLFGAERARSMADEHYRRCLQSLDAMGEAAEPLRELARFTLTRSS